jgi:hypothetical protein
LSAPIDTPTLSPSPPHTLARSLYSNNIGDRGASALAAILKETQITNLKCAAARVFAFMSMLVDMPALSPSSLTRSLFNNNIGAKGASALAAILEETQITNLGYGAAAPSVCFRVNAHRHSSAPVSAPMLAVSRKTDSALKEEPLSPRASRATPRCNRSGRPPGPQITAP